MSPKYYNRTTNNIDLCIKFYANAVNDSDSEQERIHWRKQERRDTELLLVKFSVMVYTTIFILVMSSFNYNTRQHWSVITNWKPLRNVFYVLLAEVYFFMLWLYFLYCLFIPRPASDFQLFIILYLSWIPEKSTAATFIISFLDAIWRMIGHQ